MLSTDLALVTDKGFRQYAQKYAKDQDAFFADFSQAVCKLFENGVPTTNFKSEHMFLKPVEEQTAA